MKTLDVTLQNLANPDEEISIAGLYTLSDLDKAQLAQVQTVWTTLPAERRAATMRHLVEIGEASFETDFSAMCRLGLSDPDPQTCAAAINGLWEAAEASLIPVLLKHLQSTEEVVRAAAAGALGRYIFAGEIEEMPEAKVKPAITALKALYQNNAETTEVRRRALESLGFLSDDDTARLISLAYHSSEERLRLSAVFAMGRSLDTERWGAIVLEELTAPDSEMRYEAARAVGELEYPPAVKRLAGLLEDTDEEVQLITVWALGQIGGEKARQLLIAVLESDVEYLHEEAEDALAELEFKGDNLDLGMFDFDDDDDDEWVLDESLDEDDDD